MNIIGIRSIVSSKFPFKASRISDAEKHLIHNYTLNLPITHLNQVWTTDITYIKTINDGTFFLISFIDQFSKKVVAWGLFDNQKTESIVKVNIKMPKKFKIKMYDFYTESCSSDSNLILSLIL